MPTERVEISDFLISVLGAFSEKINERFPAKPLGPVGFFERMWSFLQSEVVFNEIKIPAGPLELKAALQQNPTFKEELQKGTRGLIERLVDQAQKFALEAVNHVRAQRADPNRKVILIVDSFERLSGVGTRDQIRDVFSSAATLFNSYPQSLRFSGLSVVYTVPPYLSALAGGIGAYYGGGVIYTLPSVHIYKNPMSAGAGPRA